MGTSSLSIGSLDQFIYGRAPKPVTCGRGVEIGNGTVIPEINFTLPTMEISDASMSEVRRHYESMIDGVIQRAVDLEVPALLVEFETLPDMTVNPEWGLETTRLLSERLRAAHEKYGLKNALRLTPNDSREFERPPRMRGGRYWEGMVKFFDGAAEAGADLIAIESTGGKEICDEALVSANLRHVIYALGVLGARDMRFLWDKIVSSCNSQGIVPAGDTACGFANTAMVLADKRMIPRVFAAVVRVASVPRSLVAYERGALGPSKDCAYEGPYMKVIAGVPISMEGRAAACAHLSSVGNVSQAVCDCWSNESVPNVRLLSDYAPVVSLEHLAYDCRLLNTAAGRSEQAARDLRDILSESDSRLDPQAYVLHPDVVIRLSRQIMTASDPYSRTVTAVRAAISELREAAESGRVRIAEREEPWLDILEDQIEGLPATEVEFIAQMLEDEDLADYIPAEYGIDQ